MRVRVPAADGQRFKALEADAGETLPDLLPGLVGEGVAEGHAEEVRDLLLGAVPERLRAVLGIDLLEEEDASRCQALIGVPEQRVPAGQGDAVEDVEDRHGLEGPGQRIGIPGDKVHPRVAIGRQDLARIRLDGDRARRGPFHGQAREGAMAGSQIQQARAGRQCFERVEHAQERAGEKPADDVRADSGRLAGVGAPHQGEGCEESRRRHGVRI
jgi:hypothetical protein